MPLSRYSHAHPLLLTLGHPQAELGDKYQLFLLQDKDEQPTVVVLPEGAGAERISRGTEVGGASHMA